VAFRDAAAAAVAKLTKLKSLSWYRAPQLTDVGFQRLTALTALTRLYCDGRGLSEELYRGRHDPDEWIIRLTDYEVRLPFTHFDDCHNCLGRGEVVTI
jgi:hypothetical protein